MNNLFSYIFVGLFLSLTPGISLAQDDLDAHLDSLQQCFSSCRDDAERLRLASDLAFDHYNVDSVIFYSDIMIDLGRKLGDMHSVAKALSYKTWSLYTKGEYTKASETAYDGIVLADSIGAVYEAAKCYHHLGNAYCMLHDASSASTYYHRAIALYEQVQKPERVSSVLRSMAQVDVDNDLLDQARSALRRAVQIDHEANNIYGLSVDYWLLCYSDQFVYEASPTDSLHRLFSAKSNATKSLAYALESGNPGAVVSSKEILADVLVYELGVTTDSKRYAEMADSCRRILNEALDESRKCGRGDNVPTIMFSMVKYHLAVGQLSVARAALDSINDEIENSPDLQYVREGLYFTWADYYEKTKNFKQASHYRKKFHDLYVKNRRNDYASKSAQNLAQVKFDLQMKRKERETIERELSYEADAQKHFIVMVAIGIVLLLVSILAISAVRNANRRRKLNMELDRKNAALEQQKEEILVQNENLEQQKQLVSFANKQVTDSINSAQMIQKAALPSVDFMTQLFGEHFVIFRPKDIVSGDFYWATRVGNLRLLVAADCTGHGVPGAFVSMLGISMLNDITTKVSGEKVSAALLLDELRGNLKTALHQQGREDEDHHGIDLALVILDSEHGLVHYAGAFRPLFLYHNGSLQKVEPDRMPIGVHPLDGNNFTNHQVPVAKGDMLYMMSDGIVDQFGFDSAKGKEVKFSSKRLVAILDAVNGDSCAAQRLAIESAIDQWRGVGTANEVEQTDDNLLVGIRI